jgi:molecular chaperone DnaK
MIAGIDLGTTNSLIGVMDSGFPVLSADAGGRRLTPSVVAFPDGLDPLVGVEAANSAAPRIVSVKRAMGVRVGEGEAFPYQVGASGQPVKFSIGGGEWSPEEVSALILRKLKADAESANGCAIDRAVITVPAYFNDAQRKATLRAGELAGFHVERLLPEPTAAALAYGLDKLGKRARVAVFDLGGGTFDLSVLDLHDGVFDVLATCGDTRLGGDDFDRAIATEFGITPAEAAHFKTAEMDAKAAARLRDACTALLERLRALCARALRDARTEPADLERVLLVGGASRLPAVREFAAEFFGGEPDTSQHPDEAIALGATIQAGVLDGTVGHVTLLDVTPLSLGIETFGGLMNVLIPRNTTIPAKAGEMFTNAASNQTAMRVSVLQGEREMAADNWKLGEFEVHFPPAPRGQARVGIQFEIDADGILHVLARDTATNTDTTLNLASAIEVSDEAVEKMLEDSLEHAFEDMDDRQFAEAKIKAEEMLPAVAQALATAPADDDERTRIHAAEDAVRKALADRSTRALKAAIERLDKETAPLAARMVESLMKHKK